MINIQITVKQGNRQNKFNMRVTRSEYQFALEMAMKSLASDEYGNVPTIMVKELEETTEQG